MASAIFSLLSTVALWAWVKPDFSVGGDAGGMSVGHSGAGFDFKMESSAPLSSGAFQSSDGIASSSASSGKSSYGGYGAA